MTLLHIIAIVLIGLTVLFIGILPLVAVTMQDEEIERDSTKQAHHIS